MSTSSREFDFPFIACDSEFDTELQIDVISSWACIKPNELTTEYKVKQADGSDITIFIREQCPQLDMQIEKMAEFNSYIDQQSTLREHAQVEREEAVMESMASDIY